MFILGSLPFAKRNLKYIDFSLTVGWNKDGHSTAPMAYFLLRGLIGWQL